MTTNFKQIDRNIATTTIVDCLIAYPTQKTRRVIEKIPTNSRAAYISYTIYLRNRFVLRLQILVHDHKF